jgi:aspartate/methionine/tyrosine aminotransferase
MQYRTYVGCASPVPLQIAAAAAWNDEAHVEGFRKIYKKNFQLAQEILGIKPPQASFYIWLEVKDELEFTRELFRQKNVKVLPGSYLGRDGIGKGYVRIALVENEKKTEEVLKRIKDFING